MAKRKKPNFFLIYRDLVLGDKDVRDLTSWEQTKVVLLSWAIGLLILWPFIHFAAKWFGATLDAM